MDRGYHDIESGDKRKHVLGKTRVLMSIALLVTAAGFLYLPYTSLNIYQSLQRIPFRSVVHPVIPSSIWGSTLFPYPTGAFWTNFVVDNGDGAVAVLPYGVTCTTAGLQICYGAAHRAVSAEAITDPFVVDMQLTAAEAYISHTVSSYDNVSVTMQFIVGTGSFSAPLVKGSPFITAVYQSATPIISSNTMLITSVEVIPTPNGEPGSIRVLTLGNYQKWLVYCSSPSPLLWSQNSLSTNGPISGYVRAAIIPLQSEEDAVQVLIAHVKTYPTGGAVTLTRPSALILQETISFNTSDGGRLLMLSLPHHQPLWANGDDMNIQNASSYSPVYCMKGPMTAVIGSVWTLQYTLLSPGWAYSTLDLSVPTGQLNSIAKALQSDAASAVPTVTDPYSFGKVVGRLATLALIADYLGIASTRQQILSSLQSALSPWIAGSNADPLLYDRTWGGVVPTNGLQNPLSDFGSGYYNDHHFHYGYFTYAGAVLAKLAPSYWQTNRLFFDALIKDYCNWDPTDMDFPFARHKDLFDGHSWASGLFQEANAKNQESSSEVPSLLCHPLLTLLNGLC
jgi:endo-1,3(4)-beta-glucanase